MLRLLGIGLVGLLLATSARAERISTFKVGSWDAGAYTHSETGGFSHCAASAGYRSGITLLFSIDADLNWAFGMASDSWKLTVGDTYPVRYWVDRHRDRDGTATAVTDKQVKVPLPGDDRLFARVRRGRLMTVVAANQTMKFSLTRTNRMLSALFDCAKHWRRNDPRPQANPFATDEPANPFAAPDPGNPFAKPEAGQ